MNPLSYLNNADIGAFEGLYQQYQQDPNSVDQEWRNFFEGFEFSKADFSQEAQTKPVVDQSQISLKKAQKRLLPTIQLRWFRKSFEKRWQSAT